MDKRAPRTRLRVAVAALTAAVALAPAHAAQLQTEVINPDPASGLATKSVVYVENGAADWCSAVAVGKHVLMTAAHCVSSGTIERGLAGGQTAHGRCTCPPKTKVGGCESWAAADPKPGADIAVCTFNLPFTDGIETLSTNLMLLPTGGTIVLAGFGCIVWNNCPSGSQDYGTSAGAGPARVLRRPSAQDRYFLTVSDSSKGESALCSGDSGGPVFVNTPSGKRVAGIGHGGCVAGDVHLSAVASLGAEETVEWLCDWVAEDPQNRKIEGLTGCP